MTSESFGHKEPRGAPKETIDSDLLCKTDLDSNYMEIHRPTPVKKLEFKVTLPQQEGVVFSTKAR